MTKPSQPDSPGKVLIFGRIGTPLGYMIRDFLHRCEIPFEWVELTWDGFATLRARSTTSPSTGLGRRASAPLYTVHRRDWQQY